jgi:hypothetical protein
MSVKLVHLCGALLAGMKRGAISTPNGCVVSDGDRGPRSNDETEDP